MLRVIFLFFLFYNVCLAVSNLDFDLYKKESKQKGDTLLVIGGIHGDEPGGYFASSILVSNYKIKKGSLWVVPNLNFESLIRNRRGIHGDMNRKFNFVSKDDKDYNDIIKIKKIIKNEQIDLILNLHDGRGFYRHNWQNSIFNPSAWGQAFIIDQELLTKEHRYFNLTKLAKKVSENINSELLEDYHTFNIKNTKTKEKDEQMQLSLTYFAIKNNKPAFAVETSKNITDLTLKVKYQLKAIEGFMDIMGIKYEKDFDLNNLEEISAVVNNFMDVTINDVIKLDLNNIKPNLYYFPLKNTQNSFDFKHPLGAKIYKNGIYYLKIGNKTVTKLHPQKFDYKNEIKNILIEFDGEKRKINFSDTIKVKEYFKVKANNDYRVNVIGFSKDKIVNENNIKITLDKLEKRFSISKDNKIYKIEVYKDKYFLGMILVQFD